MLKPNLKNLARFRAPLRAHLGPHLLRLLLLDQSSDGLVGSNFTFPSVGGEIGRKLFILLGEVAVEAARWECQRASTAAKFRYSRRTRCG